MIRSKWLERALYFSLFLLAFSLPLPYIFGSGAAILMGILWLLHTNFKITFKNLKERKALWPWMIFFVLHAIGYFYSENKADADWDIQSKACFLLLPVILGAGMSVTSKRLEVVFLSFIAGVTCVGLFCIGQATLIYLHAHTVSQFYYNDLIQGLDANAVAVSWYTIFVLIILHFYKWQFYFTGNRLLKILLVAFHIAFLILLSSKMLIVFLFIVLMPLFIYQTFRNKSISAVARLSILACFAFAFFLVFSTNNPVKKRYADIIANNTRLDSQYHVAGDARQFNNLTLRIFVWNAALKNMKKHDLWWYGAGIGDVHALQNKQMFDDGIKDIYQPWSDLYNINVHNMYLESLLMLGIPGLVCLLIILFQPLFYSRKIPGGLVFILFFMVSQLFMFQESALQTQDDRIYYCFFNLVFWSWYYTCREERSAVLVTP